MEEDKREVGVKLVLDGYEEFVKQCDTIIGLAERLTNAINVLCDAIERLRSTISSFKKG